MSRIVVLPPALRNACRAIAAMTLPLLFAASCATVKHPEGGPPDTSPPVLLDTDPKDGTTRFNGDRVVLHFDEYVNRQTFQQALHVAPPMERAPEISWSGTRATLRFLEPLRADRTYVVTIGTALKDQNAGVPLASSVSFAFATGDSIDHGTLEGRVIDEKPSGVGIFAYALDGSVLADTVNPARLRPSYAVQCGGDGRFRITNMADGRYRVIAVRDKRNDFLYDAEADEYGVAQGDADVRDRDSSRAVLQFRLATEDLTPPFMQSVEALNTSILRVKFSEEPAPFSPEALVVTDSSTNARLPVLAVAATPRARFSFDVFLASPMNGGRILLRADSIRDRAGLAVPDSMRNIACAGSVVADTAAPSMGIVQPEAKGGDFAVDSAFEIHASRPMRRAAMLTLKDSAGAAVPLALDWETPLRLRVSHPPLHPASSYSLCLDLASLLDSLRGRPAGDSALCTRFSTEKSPGAGSIAGTIEDRRNEAARAIVRARRVDKNSGVVQVPAAADGRFALPRLAAGKYLLDAFIDADSNGVYSPGKPFPFRTSERFGIAGDTVRVRARWETSGVRILVP